LISQNTFTLKTINAIIHKSLLDQQAYVFKLKLCKCAIRLKVAGATQNYRYLLLSEKCGGV